MVKKRRMLWVKTVKETSAADRLPEGVFTRTPRSIALALKKAVSTKRESLQFRSAMSMLNFYINRGGTNLTKTDEKRLEKAKDELRKLFGKDED